jgi:hypothetical protein
MAKGMSMEEQGKLLVHITPEVKRWKLKKVGSIWVDFAETKIIIYQPKSDGWYLQPM